MKLSQKGRDAPPPTLKPKHAQALAQTLSGWASVHARTHWYLGDESTVDGADFYVGQDELGHLHLDGEAHVAVGPTLRTALVDAGLANPFQWSGEFVTYNVSSEETKAHAQWLFSLRYAAIGGTSAAQLIKEIQQRRS